MRFWRIYLGERDTDFTCYAVFFDGESDKEIRRIKYLNREEVTPTEEEEPMFPSSFMRSRLKSQFPKKKKNVILSNFLY